MDIKNSPQDSKNQQSNRVRNSAWHFLCEGTADDTQKKRECHKQHRGSMCLVHANQLILFSFEMKEGREGKGRNVKRRRSMKMEKTDISRPRSRLAT
eukprot:m.33955 g.33955  ORF g.33955 m.33955 type:complete len:97 (-) comp6488_c0_seq1:65-355(-)